MSKYADQITYLKRQFGNVEDDVLESVLSICDGDQQKAYDFLNLQAGQQAVQPSADGIPAGYPGADAASASRAPRAVWGPPQPVAPPVRGRGFERGRGRGRGRGARGGRAGAIAPVAVIGGPALVAPVPLVAAPLVPEKKIEAKLDGSAYSATELKNLFLQESTTFKEHFDAQTQQYPVYASVLLLLLNQGVELSTGTKTRVLAACWARKDHELSQYCLSKIEQFGLPEILKAVNLLDAGRKKRALEKRLARLDKQGTAKNKTKGVIRSTINDLSREANIGSVSGALARKIKKWVQSIPPEKLEWAALNFPKEPWRELADVIHLAPTDFQLPWFLEVCFGKEPPKDTQVSECSNLKDKPNILELIKKYKVPYSYIRKELPEVSSEIKSEVARYETLNILIWWYEELGTAGVDEIINQRLTAGEQPTLPYGKLMERLLYFKRKNVPFLPLLIPIAEKELKKLKFHWNLQSWYLEMQVILWMSLFVWLQLSGHYLLPLLTLT